VAIDVSGALYLTGTFQGDVDFGGGLRSSDGPLSDIFVLALRADGSYRWDWTGGGNGEDRSRGIDVDGVGAVFIAGSFPGTVDFGGGPRTSLGTESSFVLALDSAGSYRWDWIGQGGNNRGSAIVVGSSTDLFVAGNFDGGVNFGSGVRTSTGRSDGYITALSTAGAYRWDWQTRGDAADSELVLDVATDGRGNVVAGGAFEWRADFGAGTRVGGGESDGFVVSLDTNGIHLWDWIVGGSLTDDVLGVHTDGAGNAYAVGSYMGLVDFGGGTQVSGSGVDTFLVALDPGGAYRWAWHGSETGQVFGSTVAVDSEANVILGGSFSGNVDFGGGFQGSVGLSDLFLTSWTSAGSHRWDWTYGSPGSDQLNDLVTASGGKIALTGSTWDATSSSADAILGFGPP